MIRLSTLKRSALQLTTVALVLPLCAVAGDPNPRRRTRTTRRARCSRWRTSTTGCSRVHRAQPRAGGFVEPTAGPGPTGRTLNEVMGIAPIVTPNYAQPAGALAGEMYWGLCSGAWGLQAGTLTTQTLSDSNTAVLAGFYAATTLEAVDTDLVAGNIRSSVDLFGVMGDPNVVNTSSGTAIATDIVSGEVAIL